MKVLLVVGGWPSDFRPAYMPWLFHQVRALRRRHETTVLVLESATHYLLHRGYWGSWLRFRRGPRYFEVPGDPVPILVARALLPPGYRARRLRGARLQRAAWRALQRAGAGPFDIVHAHFSSPPGAVARWLGERLDLPYVVTEHASRFDFLLEHGLDVPGVIRDAAAMICVSAGLRDAMRPIVGDEGAHRLHWIQNGADLSVFHPGEAPRSAGVEPTVLFVGQLIERKGVDVLLDAVHRLESQGLRARVRLVGEGPEEERLRAQAAALGLAERVEFAGRVRNEEVARFYREADIAVLPSHNEANPVVVIEALASGTPVVATRCGAEAIVRDAHGIVVEPGDAAAFADAVARVHAQRERYDPADLAAYARAHYSIDAAAERIGAVYEAARREGPASARQR